MLEIRDENVFRVRAYRRAAQQLESLAEDVVLALGTGKKIPGIGPDLAAKIRECAETGTIAYLEEMRKELPRGVRQLMAVQGVGPKTAKLLFTKLRIDSVERLEEACRSGKILEVPGIRQKTSENILRGIHNSLADRALSLLKRVGMDGPVTFIGGVARQEGMVLALRDKLEVSVHVPDGPEYTTALGAALLGLQRYRKMAVTTAAAA